MGIILEQVELGLALVLKVVMVELVQLLAYLVAPQPNLVAAEAVVARAGRPGPWCSDASARPGSGTGPR